MDSLIKRLRNFPLALERHHPTHPSLCDEAADEIQRLQERVQSHEQQLHRIATFLGMDARHAKDGTIAGLVIEEIQRLKTGN